VPPPDQNIGLSKYFFSQPVFRLIQGRGFGWKTGVLQKPRNSIVDAIWINFLYICVGFFMPVLIPYGYSGFIDCVLSP